MNTHAAYGIRKIVILGYAEAVERTKTALQEQGFGVLSEIDMQQKLKEKLGVDSGRYVILGACNPPLAWKALQAEPEIGLLLPCNVIVYETDDGRCVVAAVDPDSILGVVGDNSVVAEVARDARSRLQRALESMGASRAEASVHSANESRKAAAGAAARASRYHPRRMRRLLPFVSLIVLFRCASPAPAPVVVPEVEAPVERPAQVEERPVGRVIVTASALNVRREASGDADVVAQVKKGTGLDVLAGDAAGWTKVRLASGETGWVSSRFVAEPGSSAKTAAARPKTKKGGCPPDSDFAFTETPTLAFSDRPAPGLVVVEASVNAKGTVTATKLVSNTTGEEALGFLAQREIKSAKFSPPIRNCVPRSFIFTYRRTF